MVNYEQLDNDSRLWIYQSDKALAEDTINDINAFLENFSRQWVSHNNQLKAYGKILHRRFVVLFVDQTQAGASGCSIDKSVQFIRALGERYDRDFFNRQVFYFKEGDKIFSIHQWDLAKAYEEKKISDDSLVFDSLVNTKKDFEERWLVSFGESWHKRFV